MQPYQSPSLSESGNTHLPHSDPHFHASLPPVPVHARTEQLLCELNRVVLDAFPSNADRRAVFAARDLMLEAHAHQAPRADGVPYINHPLTVTLTSVRLLNQIESPSDIQTPLLHDSGEDQPAAVVRILGGNGAAKDIQQEALNSISLRFGPTTGFRVALLTNPDYAQMARRAHPLAPKEALQALQRDLYAEHFFSIYREDPRAFVVKLADFSDNALLLDRLEPGAGREKRRLKYGPVAHRLHELLLAPTGKSDVLANCRTELLPKLEAALPFLTGAH